MKAERINLGWRQGVVGPLTAMALAACGDLPQPFRHDGVAPELARPQQVRAVTVRPIDDTAPAQAMATAQVKALAAREIPAAIGSDAPGALVLHGSAEHTDGGIGLTWVLDGPDHAPKSTARQWLPEAEWMRGTPEALAPAAAQVVGALTTEAPAEAAIAPASRRPTATIRPPADAPGDGGAALARALKNALERNGILVVGTGADYIVEGKVTVTAGSPGQESVAVAWTVRRPDGANLATIDQKGTVPAGRLQQPWGGLARDIAEGGAAGVAQAVEASRRPPTTP